MEHNPFDKNFVLNCYLHASDNNPNCQSHVNEQPYTTLWNKEELSANSVQIQQESVVGRFRIFNATIQFPDSQPASNISDSQPASRIPDSQKVSNIAESEPTFRIPKSKHSLHLQKSQELKPPSGIIKAQILSDCPRPTKRTRFSVEPVRDPAFAPATRSTNINIPIVPFSSKSSSLTRESMASSKNKEAIKANTPSWSDAGACASFSAGSSCFNASSSAKTAPVSGSTNDTSSGASGLASLTCSIKALLDKSKPKHFSKKPLEGKVRKGLKNISNLSHSESAVEGTLEPVRCVVCRKSFPDKSTMKRHVKKIHFKPQVECSICGRRVVSSMLKKHKQTHRV